MILRGSRMRAIRIFLEDAGNKYLGHGVACEISRVK
jgi:hypothetical protein